MTKFSSWHQRAIFDFLYFGFIPGFDNKYFDIYHNLQQKDYGHKDNQEESVEYYINKGVRELNNIFDQALETSDPKTNHLLSLSGGLDSRAILGGLLDRVDSKQIQTVTFGTPGTWDFEIGRNMANHAGVKHFPVDLTNHDWKWDENGLIEIARRMEQPVTLFDSYVNQKIPELFGVNCLYWSGVYGGTMTEHQVGSQTWEDAKYLFVKEAKYVRSLEMTPPSYEPLEALPIKPLCNPQILSFDDQLHFAWQRSLTHNILVRKGYHFVKPYSNANWIDFFSKIPQEFRVGQWIYKEILQTAYPQLFSLPIKNNFGYALNTLSILTYPKRGLLKIKRIINANFPKFYLGVHPNINYIDFNEELRERDDLRDLIDKNIHDLIERDLITWLDVENIWDHHQKRKENYADALLLLTALELYMKADEQKTP